MKLKPENIREVVLLDVDVCIEQLSTPTGEYAWELFGYTQESMKAEYVRLFEQEMRKGIDSEE